MHKEEHEGFEGPWYSHPVLRNALISGAITGATFALSHLAEIPGFVEIIAYLAAILLGGYHWVREGIEELFEERVIGIDILMMAAAIGAILLGLWDEAAFLVFLYGAAEGLEEFTYARTRAAIRKLLDLAPKEARLLRNGKETIVPASTLKIGDTFLVKPGEAIATDGEIVEGRSSVNEASVTGESMPVDKKVGMKVFAATMNQVGALIIRATTSFEDNTLSKMIHLVEEAQDQKSNTQRFIEKFGNRYSPLVLMSAVLLVAIPVLFGASFAEWSTRAVVLLVAAAPCALIMSTPVAVATSISKAGLNGVLVKGGAFMENLAKVKVLALDKTGTLTSGKPVVTDIVSLNNDGRRLLNLAFSVEKFSEHPLASAVVEKGKEQNANAMAVKDFKSIGGYGAQGEVEGQMVYIGKPDLFSKIGVETAYIASQMEKLRAEGKTVVLVGTKNGIEGIIGIRDETRNESKRFLAETKELGIRVVMLTGDNILTAKAFAEDLGIEDFRADLKPEAKVQVIKDLEKEYGAVAMVGDGVNDAPALAQATVGIAMGAAGIDAAIEAADIALMSDDLSKIVFAIKLSRTSARIGLQNIIFSVAILAVLIPAALGGLMTVGVAVLVHEVSELLAVANGLRTANG